MSKARTKLKLETNPTAYNRLSRLLLKCSFCKPNRNENCKTPRKHGTRKPKRKNKR